MVQAYVPSESDFRKREELARVRADILRQIQLLKQQYNELAPISRLPKELLCHIQRCVMETSGTESLIRSVTHICHYWRETALQSPYLWGTIFVNPTTVDRAFEFARRSKNTPDELYIVANDENSEYLLDVTRLVRETAKRLREIQFCTPANLDLSSILSFGASIPLLRTVSLDFYRAKGMHAPFPLANLIPHAPAMVDLTLRHFRIDWDAIGLLTNMNRLTIHAIHVLDALDIDKIRKSLSRMRHLAALAITFKTFGTDLRHITRPQPVDLPSLRKIDLEADSVFWLSSMLRNMEYSPSRNLRVDLGQVVVNDPEWLFEQRELFRCAIHHIYGSGIRYASLHSNWINLVLKGFTNTPEIREGTLQPPNCRPHCILLCSRVNSTLTEEAILQNLWHKDLLQNLAMFHVSLDYPVPTTLWVDLFANLPHLHTIEIDCGVPQLFAALVHRTLRNSGSAGDRDSNQSLPFPSLKTLLVNMAVSEKSAEYIRVDESMLQCLRQRMDLGAPINELCLRCTRTTQIPQSRLEALLKVVGSTIVHVIE